MSDLDQKIEQLKRCEPLKEAEVKALSLKAIEILVEESTVQRVAAPVTMLGNVAAILELGENVNREFRVFDAAPQVYLTSCSNSGLIFLNII